MGSQPDKPDQGLTKGHAISNGQAVGASSVETVHATLVTLFSAVIGRRRLSQTGEGRGASQRGQGHLRAHDRRPGAELRACPTRARKRLRVEEQMVKPDDERPYLEPLKTDNSDRWSDSTT
jgi:hypothetical protein